MKEKMKTYKFWVSLSAALIIFLKALGNVLQFEIDGEIVDGVVMGICGILVVLGFVKKDENVDETVETNENKNDNENNKKN